jgi:hypothetical protein
VDRQVPATTDAFLLERRPASLVRVGDDRSLRVIGDLSGYLGP